MVRSYLDLRLPDIMPESLSGIKEVQNAAAAIDPALGSVSRDIREALLLYRLDELPEPVLDLLAWQYHVDIYEPLTLPVDQKREQVKNAILLHRRKGTKWSILNQLAVLGYHNVEILEKRDVDAILDRLGWLVLDGSWKIGEEPPKKIMRPPELIGIPYLDHWAKFAVVADVTEFTRPTAIAEIKRAVNTMKPVRSQPVWAYRMILEMREKVSAWYSLLLEKALDMPYPWGNLKIDGTWKIGTDGTRVRIDGRKLDGTWKIGGYDGRIPGPKITNRIIQITLGIEKDLEAGVCCLTLDNRDLWPMKVGGGWKVGSGGPCMQGKIYCLLNLPLDARPELTTSHLWESELWYPQSPAKIVAPKLYGQRLDGSWKIGASPTGLKIGGFQIAEPGIKADIAKQLDAEVEAVVGGRHRIGREVVKIGCHHSLKLDGTWKIGEQGRKIASRCAKIDGTWKIGGTAPLKIGGGWKIGEIGPSATVEISRSKEARI